jgi:hypothetical protein
MLEEAEFYRRTPCRALCPTHHVWDGPREAGKHVGIEGEQVGGAAGSKNLADFAANWPDFSQRRTSGPLGKSGGYNKVTVGGYHNIQLAHEAQEHGDGPQSPWTKATALLGPHH